MSYGQDIVNDAEQILDGTWEWDNREYELRVRNISYKDKRRIQQYGALAATVDGMAENAEDVDLGEEEIESLQNQAENLENFSWEEEDEDSDWIASVVEEKLVRPDVDVEQTSTPKLGAIIEGMMQAWEESQSVKNAKKEMPVEEGN